MLIPSQSWGEDIAIDSSLVKLNLSTIKEKIAHYNIKIIAVTKYFGLKAMVAGYEVGIRDFAESRANEAIEKINSLPKEIKGNSKFHFIGHLQTNKVSKVVCNFDVIHSVDSFRLAEAISKIAKKTDKVQEIFLQLNNANEEQKFGFSKEELFENFPKMIELDGIKILGLMNIAPLVADENCLGELFEDVRAFQGKLAETFEYSLKELSMGMSNDYQIAAKHGATMLRIGRKLFST